MRKSNKGKTFRPKLTVLPEEWELYNLNEKIVLSTIDVSSLKMV